MKLFWLWVLVLVVKIWRVSGISPREPEDISSSDYIFAATSLPSDGRYMASVGNGHVSTNVFSDSIYMNGLYNGNRGESHRARIPAYSNLRLNSTLNAKEATFSLNTRTGLFLVHVEEYDAEIEQTIYAHRFYTRAIVNQVFVKTKNGKSASISLQIEAGPVSDDIDFDPPTATVIETRNVWGTCGRTKRVENIKYQNETSPVCIYWTDVPETLEVGNELGTTFTFVMTVDSDREVAFNEISDVLREDSSTLFSKHAAEWIELHNKGNVEIVGNLQLAKVVNGMMYYLLSSLPSEKSNQPQETFYGLSPGGLARGGLLMDYQGHNFWDTETWMFPAILMFFPKTAERILGYRINGIISAADNAEETGYKGVRFPWESGFTGSEVTPDCCPEVVNFEQHITACIAFAARQYIAMTGDKQWLEDSGCDLTKKIAEFWESRVELNSANGLYDIKGVMGPDEDHPDVDNSVFTNVVAALALYLGEYTTCLCNGDSSASERWSDIASHLTLMYDSELDYHPQFQGYERPTAIKQADVVLLGFPLLYKMNESTMANDLIYYENVTRENGPAMTWSMHTVGHLRLRNNEQATQLFDRSYKPYVRDPYKIWTEAIEPEIGAVNFITGMGGFMQALVFGYGGMSIYLDRLEILNPQLPPNTDELRINSIKYLGSSLSLHIAATDRWIRVNETDSNRPLILQDSLGGVLQLENDMTVPLALNTTYNIRLATPGKCPLPADVVGQIKDKKNNLI